MNTQATQNPFEDDDFDGNDDHIDALKDSLREALGIIETMRRQYGELHDQLNDLIGEAEAPARLHQDMIPDDYAALTDQMAKCVVADHEAKEFLAQFPEE